MRNGMVNKKIIMYFSVNQDKWVFYFNIDGNESDAEVAELEEQEALAIQQRMAQQLEEADFGLDFITHLKVDIFILIE